MRWDVFAVFVAVTAVFFTVSPTAIDLVQKAFTWILRKAVPRLGRCERLEWQDIPDGTLHVCTSVAGYCRGRHRAGVPLNSDDESEEHQVPHIPDRCWEDLVSTVLNRAWNSASRREVTVKKPSVLPSFGNFLCTDVKTINMLRVFMPSDSLDIHRLSKHAAVVHLQPPYLLHYPELTKNEAAKIADGHPPWYKEKLITVGGVTLDHPIQEEADLLRGGWILGVGLSRQEAVGYARKASSAPLRKSKLREYPEKAAMLDRAFGRIEHALQNLKVHFPEELPIKESLAIFQERAISPLLSKSAAWAGETGLQRSFLKSNLYMDILPRDPLQAYSSSTSIMTPRPWARTLTAQQCATAIRVFSTVWPASDDEARILQPVLRQVIQAAMYGMYEVSLFSPEPVGDIPGLKGCRHVFLRTCSKDEVM